MNENRYTKASIKARMYSRIAALWNIRNVDDLDPVIKLLVESLASEVFGLSGELDTIEQRIVEKLARAFTPSFMMAASPAHAVMHTHAISGSTDINAAIEFEYKESRFLQQHNLYKLTMTPVCSTTIFNAETVSLIHDGRFYTISPRGGREHIANSVESANMSKQDFWIGVKVGENVKSLKGMAFFFEFPLLDDYDEYLRLVEHGRWSHNNKPISVLQGLESSMDKDNLGVYEVYNHIHNLRNEIKAKYDKHFVTIKEDLHVSELRKEIVPHELKDFFVPSFLQDQRNELIWIKVEFPPDFNRNDLSYMAVHINCFPAANIYCRQTQHNLTPLTGIIRLEKEQNEYFLFVDSVSDSTGKAYKQVLTHDDNDASTYMLRRGGSERFSSLDARDYLDRMLELCRDEAIAFSGIDKDISGSAEDLMEHLSVFDRKIQSYDNNLEHTSYIIPGADMEERASLTVRYLMTNGVIANGIRTLEPFAVPEFGDLQANSAILMTTTRGGHKSPPASRQKDIFQYMLMSGDRIYTQEDIKFFCRAHYGEYFNDIEVKCGFEVGDKPKEGIIRVTRVTLHGMHEKAGAESAFIAQDILAGMQRRSPDGIHYKIIMD